MVSELFELVSHPEVREILLGDVRVEMTHTQHGEDSCDDSQYTQCRGQSTAATLGQLLTMQQIMHELEARVREDSSAGEWKPEKIGHVLSTVFGDLDQNQQELVQLLTLQKNMLAQKLNNHSQKEKPESATKADPFDDDLTKKLESGLHINIIQRSMLSQVIKELVKVLLAQLSNSKVDCFLTQALMYGALADTLSTKNSFLLLQEEFRSFQEGIQNKKLLPGLPIPDVEPKTVKFAKSVSQLTFQDDRLHPAQNIKEMLGNIDAIASKNLAILGIRHKISPSHNGQSTIQKATKSALKTPSCNKQAVGSPGMRYCSSGSAKTQRERLIEQQTRGRNLFGSMDSPDCVLVFRNHRSDSDASSQLKSSSMHSSPIPKLSFGEYSIKKTPKSTKREVCKLLRTEAADLAAQVTFSNEPDQKGSQVADVANSGSSRSESKQSGVSKTPPSINNKLSKQWNPQVTPDTSNKNNIKSQGTPQLVLNSGCQLMITPDKTDLLGLKGLSPIQHPLKDVETTNLKAGLDFFSPGCQNFSYAASLRTFLEKGSISRKQLKYSSYAKGQMSSSSWKKMGGHLATANKGEIAPEMVRLVNCGSDLKGTHLQMHLSSSKPTEATVREFFDGFSQHLGEK